MEWLRLIQQVCQTQSNVSVWVCVWGVGWGSLSGYIQGLTWTLLWNHQLGIMYRAWHELYCGITSWVCTGLDRNFIVESPAGYVQGLTGTLIFIVESPAGYHVQGLTGTLLWNQSITSWYWVCTGLIFHLPQRARRKLGLLAPYSDCLNFHYMHQWRQTHQINQQQCKTVIYLSTISFLFWTFMQHVHYVCQFVVLVSKIAVIWLSFIVHFGPQSHTVYFNMSFSLGVWDWE